jgi:hypothetical protein
MTEHDKPGIHSDELTVPTVDSSARTLDASATRVSQRQARFALEANQVFPIVHVNDMDESDVHETWFGKQEDEQMKRDTFPVVYKMRNNLKVEETSDEETARGLECQTQQGQSHREKNNKMARDAVLMEQDRQRMVGAPDEELVAQAYYNASNHCQVAAFNLGLRDQQAVIKQNLENMTWYEWFVQVWSEFSDTEGLLRMDSA